jgi:hypothetical protein
MFAAEALPSSDKVLGVFVLLALIGWVLFQSGALAWLIRLGLRIFSAILQAGFRLWKRLFAGLHWGALLGIILGAQLFGMFGGGAWSLLCILGGLALLLIGVTGCIAYVIVDQERYEVSRGYKVLHSPVSGQQLAENLLRYGPRVGLSLLLTACLASITGFTLLNLGLYTSFGTNWYVLGDMRNYASLAELSAATAREQQPAGYFDFLSWTLLQVASAADLVDLVNSSKYARVAYVHAAYWPVRLLLMLFRSFFTVVLIRQLFAWFRDQRLLQDSVRDFWSPHEPIQRRASEALAQQGSRAVYYLIKSMESVEFLTPEQQTLLPRVIATVGPIVVPLLVEQRRHTQEHVREVMVASIGELQAVDALPALADRASDESERVRQRVAESLGAIFALGVAQVRKIRSRRRSQHSVGLCRTRRAA